MLLELLLGPLGFNEASRSLTKGEEDAGEALVASASRTFLRASAAARCLARSASVRGIRSASSTDPDPDLLGRRTLAMAEGNSESPDFLAPKESS